MNDMRERFSAAEESGAYLSLISGNHDTPRIADHLDERELRIFYLFLFALPGIPFLLYGDELGMKTSDLPSKDGGYQRTGTRIPMIWDDSEPYHGFSKTEPYLPFSEENKVSLEQAVNDENSLYHFLKKLIALRKQIPDLRDPHLPIEEKDRIFRFERGGLDLIINLSKKTYPYQGEKIIATEDFDADLPSGAAVLLKRRA